jgi:rod shape-determining protein MreC
MNSYLRRYWGRIALFSFMVLFILAVLVTPVQWKQPVFNSIFTQTQPFLKDLTTWISYSQNWLNQQGASILRQNVMNQEIISLQKENALLRQKYIVAQHQEKEFNRLRSLLGLKDSIPFKTIGCEVIAISPSSYYLTLIINKGTKDGITRNKIMLHQDGVVGRILEVSPWTSKVMLIADQRSAVAVMIERTGSRAIMEGMGNGQCKLMMEEPQSPVKVGDRIMTSGIGGIFPKGLYVGLIDRIERDKRSGWATMVRVKPAADNYSIQEGLIILHPVNPPVQVQPIDDGS